MALRVVVGEAVKVLRKYHRAALRDANLRPHILCFLMLSNLVNR
jgi:hypothetical protein